MLFLVGCSATGPVFEKAPINQNNEAVIYFYRSDASLLSGVGAYFLINNHRVSKLQRNGYSYHYVPTGTQSIGMEWNCSLGACLNIGSFDFTSMQTKPRIEIQVKPGEQKFFKLFLSENSWSWGFWEVDRDTALSEIRGAYLDNEL